MAENTVWVSIASGTDTDDGSTYLLAKKTIGAGVTALVAGKLPNNNTLNIVADGDYPMQLNAFTNDLQYSGANYKGTSYSGTAFGLKIQGVDSSGSPSQASLVADATNYSGLLRLYGGLTDSMAYVSFEGLKFDWTAAPAVGTAYGINCFRSWPHPFRVRYCAVIGAAIGGAQPAGARHLVEDPTTNDTTPVLAEGWDISYNYFQNTRQALYIPGGFYDACTVHHNVAVWDTDDAAGQLVRIMQVVGTGPYVDASMHHNTVFVREEYTLESITGPLLLGAADVTDMDAHSNLVYTQPASDVSSSSPGSMFVGTGSPSGTRANIGYNYFGLGTNWSNLSSWTGGGFYALASVHPDYPGATTNISATYTTDIAVTNTTPAVMFNDTTAAWTWANMNDSGYSTDLAMDLRPLVGRTTGYNGSTTGALPSIIDNVTSSGTDTNVSNVFLDSLPFFRPIIKAETVTMVRVRRNGVAGHIDLRHYLDDHIHNESTHRVAKIETTASATLSFAGVNTAKGVAILTDTAVQATFSRSGGGSFVTTIDEAASYDGAQFTTLSVSNTSSTTATVQVVAFD